MKKIAALSTTFGYLSLAAINFVSAQVNQNPNNISIANPGVGYTNISDFLNAAIRLAFIVALIAVLVMLVWGAIQWIFSGGDKEAVAAARNRIIHALVGLAILAVAFALVTLAGSFVGINILKPGGFNVPNPDNPTPSLK